MDKTKETALVKVGNQSLKEKTKKAMPKIADGAKRIGKVVGLGSLAALSLGLGALGSTVLGSTAIAAIGRNYCDWNRNKSTSKLSVSNRTKLNVYFSKKRWRKKNLSRCQAKFGG